MPRLSVRRLLCGLLLLVLAGPGLAATRSAAAQSTADLVVEPYTFHADDGRTVEAELGRFRVPENRRDGGDRTVELAFVRFPSTNPDPGPPIVYLAGGPGGSGTGTAEGTRFDLFMAMRDVADVIAFDQRGTGLSERPPDCPHRWQYPSDRPGTREAILASALDGARACAAYWRAEGVDLAAYNTAESADDLEALRRVLGVDRLQLWSISYGTHLALAALKRHPGSIARVVLAGVEGPDHTVKLPSDQQRLLEAIDAIAAADPRLRTTPRLLDAVATVLARLEAEPVVVPLGGAPEAPDSIAIGAFDVQWATAALLGSPEYSLRLPALYAEMLAGDFSNVAWIVQDLRGGGFRAMPYAMDAASGLSAERAARLERERRETLLGDAINLPFPAVIDALGVPDLGPAFRAPVETDVPALFISGTLDGRTPVSNADEVRAGFSNSAHLVLENAGHSDPLFLSSPRIEAVMRAFLSGEPVADERVVVPLPLPLEEQ